MKFCWRVTAHSLARSTAFHFVCLVIGLLGCSEDEQASAGQVLAPDGPGETGDASAPSMDGEPNGAAGQTERRGPDASVSSVDNAPGVEPGSPDVSVSGTGGSRATPNVDPPDIDASPDSNGPDETRAGGPCPETPPIPNTPCESRYAFCSYGDGPSAGCRQRFTCHVTDEWVGAASPGGPCVQPGSVCDTMPEGTCDQVGQSCAFGDSICSCNPEQTEICGGDGCHPLEAPIPQQWACGELRVQEGCPELPPNAGVQCDDEPFSCLYGEPCTGVYVGCVDGYIEWEEALCP